MARFLDRASAKGVISLQLGEDGSRLASIAAERCGAQTMFGLFKPPIETQLCPLIWPQPNDNAIELCRTEADLICPTGAVQAATALANLAIAGHYLGETLPANKAHDASSNMERMVFARIAEYSSPCVVASVLKLPEERRQWRMATGQGPETTSTLSLILRTVFNLRIQVYRADMARAMGAAMGGTFHGYGPMGFVAKRWLSQLSGRSIVREDDLAEDGFLELGVASLYFTYKAKEIVDAVSGR